ncbi:MAG: long-chain fatty acid--CoA ligase [Anaerolineae bacterium]|nr:long-chain fatty acid--CoA ligase [Anaerolineae bacterium]
MSVTYADKPWLKHYDKGVPRSLQPYPSHPLHQFLIDAAARNPDGTAVLTSAHLPLFGRKKAELTYRELNDQSDALASALLDMGVKKGDRVAVMLPNAAQFPIAFFAVLKIGAIVCAANPTHPAGKLIEQFKDCGATTIITLSLFYNTVKKIQPQTDLKNVIVTNIKEYLPGLAAFLFTVAKERKEGHRIEKHPVDHALPDLLARYKGKRPNVNVSPNDVAIFQYTGGTTGVPKAAVSTHQALVANLVQIRAFLLDAASPEARFLAAIPLFHVFGMVTVLSTAVSLAASMIMVPNPRDTHDVLEVIDHYRPTLFMGVPAMYNAINNHPDVAAGKYELHSIRACVSGSAPLAPTTKRRFEELTGGKLIEGFGMSECPTAVCCNPLYGENRTGSIGLPFPDVEMRVVSLDDELSDVPVGKIGELVIWSPNLMIGYHNMPDETESALRLGPDGKKWLYTGDIGYMDEEGYFYIVDRKKDMALIGGFNVYPTQVEKVLLEHPSIQEVAVAAVPHDDPSKAGQEMLKAWVIVKAGQTLTEQDIVKFAQSTERLARREIPTRYEYVSELPRTLVGKVLRRELIAKELEARGKPSVGIVPVEQSAH